MSRLPDPFLINRPLRGCVRTDNVVLTVTGSDGMTWTARVRGQAVLLRIVWTNYESALIYWCAHVQVIEPAKFYVID